MKKFKVTVGSLNGQQKELRLFADRQGIKDGCLILSNIATQENGFKKSIPIHTFSAKNWLECKVV